MKKRKFLALALAFITALSCMSVTAFATGDEITVESTTEAVEWSSGNYVVNEEDVQLTSGLTITGNVTLTIDADCSLFITGHEGCLESMEDYSPGVGLTIGEGASLTVNGSGTLTVTGGTGVAGISGHEEGQNGATGVRANGTLYVNGVALDVTGGAGGDGYADGGSGGNGGSSFTGTIVMMSGKLSLSNAYGGIATGGEDYTDGTLGSFGSFSQSSSFSGGIFSVDVTSYTAEGYFCEDNTDSTTKTIYPYMIVPGTYLDLETSDTYQDTHSINQTYTLTQNGATTYTDVTKVKLEWTLPEIAASFTLNKTWDPDNLCWVDSKNTAAIGQKQATFTFTNYSSVKVYAELSFLKSIGSGNSSAIVDSTILDTVVNDDAERTLKSGSIANGATFTHTYTPTASEFNSLSVGSGTYGTYTATIKKVYKVTFDANSDTHEFATDINAQYIANGGKVTEPASVYDKNDGSYYTGFWYKDAERTTVWDFDTDTVTEDTTLYAGWGYSA